jgi:hypothetical protein
VGVVVYMTWWMDFRGSRATHYAINPSFTMAKLAYGGGPWPPTSVFLKTFVIFIMLFLKYYL